MVRFQRLLLALLLATLPVGGVTAHTNREDARYAIRLGNEKFGREEYEAAIKEYSRVPRNAGEAYEQSLYNTGMCYYELWRIKEAIVFYQRAIAARKGRYPKAWYALGVALEDSGLAGQAKDAYLQSINTSRGGYGAAQFRLGIMAAGAGDYATAATLFRKAASRSGEQVAASHNNLGVMLAITGHLTEAEREFEIAYKETDGAFQDAAQNLRLCHSWLSRTSTNQMGSLKLVEIAMAVIK